jgi:surfactin synthase thioesterase subunit
MTEPALLAPWIPHVRTVPGVRIVLLCFPYAGGGASAFRGLAAALASRGIEVWPVQPPGRETRFSEPFATDLVGMTKTLADVVMPHIGDRPYAVYGHSGGAIMAYAFARHAATQGHPMPRHLFVSGCRPPQHPDPEFPLHELPHERFLTRLFEYGRMPPDVMDYPDIAETMVATARADLRLVETYPWPDDPALNCPLTALGGVEDATVPVELLPEWRMMTCGTMETVLLPGGHFLSPAGEQRLTEVIRRALSGY